MHKRYWHLTDPPIVLKSHEVLEDNYFVMTGSIYGRFIFTQWTVVDVLPVAREVIIRNNIFTTKLYDHIQ